MRKLHLASFLRWVIVLQVTNAKILDGLGLEGSVLDGLAEWPASTTRKEWFAITRQLIQETIADMDLDPAALAEVEEAFIGAGLL